MLLFMTQVIKNHCIHFSKLIFGMSQLLNQNKEVWGYLRGNRLQLILHEAWSICFTQTA